MGVNMSVHIESLQTLPPGVAEATALIEHVDDSLHHGFTRLGRSSATGSTPSPPLLPVRP